MSLNPLRGFGDAACENTQMTFTLYRPCKETGQIWIQKINSFLCVGTR